MRVAVGEDNDFAGFDDNRLPTDNTRETPAGWQLQTWKATDRFTASIQNRERSETLHLAILSLMSGDDRRLTPA